MDNIHIGKKINSLSHIIKRVLHESEGLQNANKVTGTNGFIIGFLARNNEKEIFQKDIEREFSITRSTTSRILSLMEEKDIIKRLPVERDSRLKKIVLTERGYRLNDEIWSEIIALEELIIDGFSQNEIETLSDFLRRIKLNLENGRTVSHKSEFKKSCGHGGKKC